MKIIYIHHGNRNVGNPPSQEDDLTELDIKIVNLLQSYWGMLKSRAKSR